MTSNSWPIWFKCN